MKTIKYLWLLIFSVYGSNAFAESPICHSFYGTETYVLDFSEKSIDDEKNKAGQTIYAHVDAQRNYSAECGCTKDSAYYYLTASENPALQKSANRNNVQYYSLNDHIDVGLSIQLSGYDFANIPFVDKAYPIAANACRDNKIHAFFDFGSNAIIYIYLKQPIVGSMDIPATLLTAVSGATEPQGTSNTEILSRVLLQGNITVPQRCEISGGQTIEVDFDKIPASDFSSTPGAAITQRKIPIKATVKCTGISPGQNLDVSLHANQAASLPSVIQTSNSDVGITVFDKYGNEVGVNGGRMDADMGNVTVMGTQNGDINFTAAPTSVTGSRPQPGEFSATATITMEFKN